MPVLLDNFTRSIPFLYSVSSYPNTEEPPATTYACYCYDFIVESVLMGALCLFGFAGNFVATACLRQDNSKTATPFLLISLVVADTLFLVAVFGLRVLTSIDTFAARLTWLDPAVPVLGKFVYPTALVVQMGTIYLTLVVTFNRYVSVCWPYRAADWCSVRSARRHVAAVIAFSVAFNLPRFFEYEIVVPPTVSASGDAIVVFANTMVNGSEAAVTSTLGLFSYQWQSMTQHPVDSDTKTTPLLPEKNSTASAWLASSQQYDENNNVVGDGEGSYMELQMTAMAENQIYRLVYTNFLYFIVVFLFPLGSLTFLNQRLIAALGRAKKKRELMLARGKTSRAGTGGSGAGGDKSEDDITFMLIVVVMVFVVTQTPAAVTQMIESWLDEESLGCPEPFFFYVRISDLLVVANSSLNFVVYCLCSRRFRQILTNQVCRCGSKDNDGGDFSRRMSSSADRVKRPQYSLTSKSAGSGRLAVIVDVEARRGLVTTIDEPVVNTAAPPTRARMSDSNELITESNGD